MSLNNKTELAIIEAARKVFISKGYSGATTAKIASEAKVNKALLHYYYKSKEKLFEIVLTESVGIIIEKLKSIIKSEDSLEIIIDELIDVYVDTLIKHPYLPNFIINEISTNPERVLKVLFHDNLSTFTIFRVVVTIRNKLNEGNRSEFKPFDVILNIISLNVFPFLVRPLITNLFKMNDEQFNSFMNNRKSGLLSFILRALKQ